MFLANQKCAWWPVQTCSVIQCIKPHPQRSGQQFYRLQQTISLLFHNYIISLWEVKDLLKVTRARKCRIYNICNGTYPRDMADPFELRLFFSNRLRGLNPCDDNTEEVVSFALKHRDLDEDLHSCILEQLESVCALDLL